MVMTRKTLLIPSLLALTLSQSMAQTGYDARTLCTERLDRGVVAVRTSDGKVAVSWRILGSDAKGEPFDVYRNGQRLNAEPLTAGGSFFIDSQPLQGQDAIYEVRARQGQAGRYTLRGNDTADHLTVPIQKPEGDNARYRANDAAVADVDGDGKYEIILKWDPTNARDNSHDGFTAPTIIDCYRITSLYDDKSEEAANSLLWRINLGTNIRSGAHYTPFIAYDLDGDGKAELMVKTADGTRDGQGNVIGDSLADWRNGVGRILDGPEYITVFDGLTGKALDTKPYIPERGNVADWGDSRGNRSERYLAAVGYFGNKSQTGTGVASAVFCRGYYTRSVLAAWDWDGRELKSRWVFDTDNRKWKKYAGQGNHNLRVADVDGDGLDEITYGSMCVDHDGTGLYNTGMGHGDAIHLLASPDDNHLYIWDCHENKRDGSDLRDAATGKVVFQIKSKSDVGRAMAADIDPTNRGVEMWTTDSHGIRNMKGEAVGKADDAEDPQHQNQLLLNGRWLSINFGIWWDGDLLRELLDHETVSKYDWENRRVVDVKRFDGMFNNGTKSNPCLQADIIGDWREEVIIRNRESSELRIYTTTIPTEHRIDCLMLDIPYRLSVATQNVGYNQPPETGYYIGPDRTDYLK